MSTTPPTSLQTLVESARSLPLGITLPLPIFVALVGWYAAVAPRFAEERKRAYVLSSISSLAMTLSSLPFVYCYFTGGVPAVWAAGQEGWTKTLADAAVAYFGTYLFSECDDGADRWQIANTQLM